MSGLWPIGYFPKRTSTQRFDEAPKLDGGLGSGTVPVFTIPLAFRRAAACAVKATNGPAVIWTLLTTARFFLEKNRNHRPAAEIFCQEKIFPESGMQTLVN
jgi:hypothetical protein